MIALPAILRLALGEPAPKPAPPVTVTAHRQPLHIAADVQATVLDLWRRHSAFCPALVDDLTNARVLDACGLLVSDQPGGPLVFRRIAAPTVRALGRNWAAAQLGRPNDEDPHGEYAALIGAEYREAIRCGKPVYNRLVIHGLPHRVDYSHLLVGWTSPAGREALLAVIDWPQV